MINVRLPWPPSVNNYYAVVRGRKILSKRGREYKKQSKTELMIQRAARGVRSRLQVTIDAYPPDNRVRDIDNLIKPVCDALQDYGMFLNDAQIDDLRIRRLDLDKGRGHVWVRVSQIESAGDVKAMFPELETAV
jgi:crossover junction endodeoxyribonuclease RusA